MTISNLIKEITTYKLCNGVDVESNELLLHSIPCDVDLQSDNPVQSKVYKRSKDCCILKEGCDKLCCMSCDIFVKKFHSDAKRKLCNINIPAKLNAPLCSTHPNKVTLALQQQRKECKQLKTQIEKMKKEIESLGVSLDEDLSTDIKAIMNEIRTKCLHS